MSRCCCRVVAELSSFLRHIVGLNYNDRPDYQCCRGFFTKALKSVGAKVMDKLNFGPTPPPAVRAPTTPKVILLRFLMAIAAMFLKIG